MTSLTPTWRRLAAVAVTVLAAAACGSSSGGGSSAPKANGPITLTMWYWGQQEAHGLSTFVADSVKKYEALHPNITIKTVLQSTDNLMPNFAAAAKAKKGPDIEYRWGGIWSLQDAWDGNLAPISDYIPASERAHYLNSSEDTWDGKLWSAPWYVQPSFPILYRKDVLAKAGVKPPQTWSQLLAACDKLNAKGITPIAGGVKDGWFGGWLYATIGGQGVRSIGDVLKAVAGEKRFTDGDMSSWWTRLQEMRDHKCWNNDINSLELYQGQQRWVQGKAAMTMVAGSDAKKFILQGGKSRVGVMAMPRWGNGPYAGKLGSTSQTVGITAWTKHPREAADFIMFMHTRERMSAWFKITGAFPADDRFSTKAITLPQQRVLFNLVRGGSPYLENFIPTELDSKANFAQAQLVLGGNADAKQAAQATEKVAQRIRLTQRKLISNFKLWAASFG